MSVPLADLSSTLLRN